MSFVGCAMLPSIEHDKHITSRPKVLDNLCVHARRLDESRRLCLESCYVRKCSKHLCLLPGDRCRSPNNEERSSRSEAPALSFRDGRDTGCAYDLASQTS